MRILITGGEGLLATGFTRTPSDHTIRALSRAQLDVTDAAAAREVIGHIRPDWVVHAAAMTDTGATAEMTIAAMATTPRRLRARPRPAIQNAANSHVVRPLNVNRSGQVCVRRLLRVVLLPITP